MNTVGPEAAWPDGAHLRVEPGRPRETGKGVGRQSTGWSTCLGGLVGLEGEPGTTTHPLVTPNRCQPVLTCEAVVMTGLETSFNRHEDRVEGLWAAKIVKGYVGRRPHG